jgi:hypothetical protein
VRKCANWTSPGGCKLQAYVLQLLAQSHLGRAHLAQLRQVDRVQRQPVKLGLLAGPLRAGFVEYGLIRASTRFR